MRLYHGSLEVVEKPYIKLPSRTLDYGTGFYTTTSEEQAEQWARRRMMAADHISGYVNIYELDESALLECKVLWFDDPDENWLDFVMANRVNQDYHHDYDIVYGPVANDRVYAAFALYESGLLDKQALISELRTFKLVDQMLFHTEKSLSHLRFIEVNKVR